MLFAQILISGLVCGLIVFQSAFVAPTVFRDLPEESRPVILRSLFPKLFKSITLAGILLILLAFLEGSNLIIAYCVGVFTFLAGLICNSMIGATNRARDYGNDKLFSTLHRISVFLTISVLLTNLIWVFIV